MKRLPANKRNQLIGVIVVTLVLICAVYFMLILPQNEKNSALAATIAKENTRLEQYTKAITKMGETTTSLSSLNQQLNQAEDDVASGDLYAWSVDVMRRFKPAYRVDVPSMGQPSPQSDCEVLGDFPYKQIRFPLAGTAYYHDLGRFISDFENKFPHCRVVDLSTDPAGQGPGGGEKLNFRMEIVALVKPNN